MKRLVRMHARNFLSLGEVDLDLTDLGLVLIEGPNGRGKSALVDAVVWCFYGITLRGYENDEVVHRRVGKDCYVTIQIEDGDDTYSIRRARKHTEYKNTLRVTRNEDEDISRPSTTETQELIDELLGSRRTFLSSVVFGQDRAYRFSQLTDKEQKEILDEVLGVGRFAEAGDAARKQASTIEAALDIKRRDLEKAEAARDQADEDVVDLRKKDAAFDSAREDKLQVEFDKINKAKSNLADCEAVDVAKLKTKLDKVRKEVPVYEKVMTDLIAEEATKKAARAQTKLQLDQLTTHVQKHLGPAQCPTCGQDLDKKQRDATAKSYGKQLKEMQTKFDEVVKPAHEDAQRRLADAGEALRNAKAAVLAAEKAHNEAVGLEANARTWRSRIEDGKRRIKEIEEEINPYAALVAATEKKRAKAASEALLLLKQVDAEEERLKVAQFWVQAFGARGLRSLLLDSSLPTLNQEAKRVSRAITDGEIEIEFSTTSELKSGKTVDRFDVRVDNKQGAGSYLGNSQGERARVDLCVGLALQRLVASRSTSSFNVAFFDEVFDHLDSSAHERVVEVLGEIDKESVFVISHDENLKAWFPATITMVKRDGFSQLEG